ncbi:FixG Ig-like domain-containing protein [Arenibaculum pallidiluteum]|uniref:FixG Ig-like domain-containing protein n=1 Tax=Arenibaculum pallidiluteum TaxID=2812559 RepID=UPI002E2A8A17|nr:FixG Ig-like domain-containing protein [Arenibaculum pallidiluteum]
MRPRTIVYALVLLVVASVMLGTLALRPRIEVNVLRDRAPLFVELSDGSVRNAYTLKILNMAREPREYSVQVEGLPGARLSLAGREEARDVLVLAARPDAVSTSRVTLTVPRAALRAASTPVVFRIVSADTGEQVSHDSVFLGPGR